MITFNASSTVSTFRFMESHALTITVLMPVMIRDMVFCTVVMAVSTFSRMVSHTSMTISLQFSQMNRNGNVMTVTAALMTSFIAMSATVMTFFIVSNAFATASLTLCSPLLTLFGSSYTKSTTVFLIF